MGKLLIMLGIFALPAAYARQETNDLGIPEGVSWQGASDADAAAGSRASSVKELHPLEVRFWDRVEDDLIAVDRWREGLLDTLRFARGRPQIFPPQPREGGVLYEEYRDTALNSWHRGVDYMLALDALSDRYREFHALSEPRTQRVAFLVAYAAFLAQARFSREWSALCANDSALVRLFDEEIPSLGVRAGGYSAVEQRFRGASFRSELSAMHSYYVQVGKSQALEMVLGSSRGEWARLRSSDLRQLPISGSFRPHSRQRALDMLRRSERRDFFPVRSIARAWTAEFDAPNPERLPFLPPQPDWSTATISTRAAYAVDTLRHWFRVDASTQARPEVWITQSQVREMEPLLQPGDILLVRRDRFLGEIGLAGYWHHAGIYVGTRQQQAAFFHSKRTREEVEKAYAQAAGPAPEAPQRLRSWRKQAGKLFSNLNPWKIAESTEPVIVEKKAPPPDPLSVLHADEDGVRLETLARFAAADAFAVLRPRAGTDVKGEALARALPLLRKPYDFQYDVESAAAVSGAELVYTAYYSGRGAKGLVFPLSDINGRWSFSSNALARKYDSDFGTKNQQLDWILFYDKMDGRQEAAASTLEDFRRSWRRPKWTLTGE
ncbi:MAG: YiiX/YebB-like N1pC/P60 family cysteine hydrolase [Elusimicrobiota bacterium]